MIWKGARGTTFVVPKPNKLHLYRDGEWYVRIPNDAPKHQIAECWRWVDRMDALEGKKQDYE